MQYPHINNQALFHDISKPATRRRSPEKNEWTFYGHDVVGARVTRETLFDLKFPKETIDKVVKLVRWHMFFSDTEKITLSAVRRLVANVGKDLVWDLMNLRTADRIGTGRPKENPYRLRKYKAMVEEVMDDPISVGMLKISGQEIMKETGLTAGPKIGFILHALLDSVLDDPNRNNEAELKKMAKTMANLPDVELKKLGEKGKEMREKEDQERVKKIRNKYHVD